MPNGNNKIKIIYSSTNEKELKDVIISLIRLHERNYTSDKKVAKG